MAIRVQGETYDSPEDLIEEIAGILQKVEGLNPDDPETVRLVEHAELLQSALGSADGGSLYTGAASEDDSPPATDEEPEPEDDDDDNEIPPEAGEGMPVCPMCEGAGVLAVEPPPDPNSDVCPDCQGWGKVYTGSHVPGHVIRDCKTCQGQGWRDKMPGVTAPRSASVNAVPEPEAPGAIWDVDTEQWAPPPGSYPPWQGATFDGYYGKWV